jgi:3-oxoacyl-[acyl-carrier protein] reductase
MKDGMDPHPQGARLNGQVAIITGACGGIGSMTCRALRAEGAHVVAVDREPGAIDHAVEGLASDGREAGILGVAADVRDEAQVAAMVAQADARFGRVDILVHCAGILRGSHGGPKPLAQVATAEWDDVIDTNLRGTFLCNRAVLPDMIRQRAGQIVNLSSTSGRQGRALDAVYCASKFGVIGLTESLAEEVRQFGIRVYAVLPDAVRTPLWEQNGAVPVPSDALAPERVADLIRYILTLPGDMVLRNLVVAPFHTRRRKTAPRNDVGPGSGVKA